MNVLQFIAQNHAEVLELTAEHLWLVGASIVLAVLIGIPLGILITRWPVLKRPVLGGANIIQTIPSLALFGFLLPAPWIGARIMEAWGSRVVWACSFAAGLVSVAMVMRLRAAAGGPTATGAGSGPRHLPDGV